MTKDLEALPVFDAWRQVTAERQRQIYDEGWSAAHDSAHRGGELLLAATCYFRHLVNEAGPEDTPPLMWPWAADWWKPKDRRRNLVRAGALCLAERDRCIRAGLRTGPADHLLGIVLRELVLLATEDEPETCFICGQPFKPGDMVLPDVTEGLGHRACFGDDRDSYVKDIDTGEPLGPDDPIPAGWPWEPGK